MPYSFPQKIHIDMKKLVDLIRWYSKNKRLEQEKGFGVHVNMYLTFNAIFSKDTHSPSFNILKISKSHISMSSKNMALNI
jgi:hypothetical protein